MFSLPPANEVCEGYVFTGICLSTGGACVAGGACTVGGACVVEDVHGRGACMVRTCMMGGMCGWGSAWPGGGGSAWPGGMYGGGTCVVGACMAGGHAWQGDMHSRRDGHCSGRYASYWNAFLFEN